MRLIRFQENTSFIYWCKPIIKPLKWIKCGQMNPAGAFSSPVSHAGQQRLAVKQWCGCWGSHIYPPYSALQQLHRHKKRHHYMNRGLLIGPATWGARARARGGERLGRRTRCGRSVWDRRNRGEKGWKSVCVQYFFVVLISPEWKSMNGLGIVCQLDVNQWSFGSKRCPKFLCWRANTET